MSKLPLAVLYAVFLLLLPGSVSADSTVAVVRDRYGGSLQYDTQFDRYDPTRPYGEPTRYSGYNRYDRYRNPVGPYTYSQYGSQYGSRYGDRPPLPQYSVPPQAYPYGGSYYPPNADIDPDQTRFNSIYEYNSRTIGQ